LVQLHFYRMASLCCVFFLSCPCILLRTAVYATIQETCVSSISLH
jgi:hypothetical protein